MPYSHTHSTVQPVHILKIYYISEAYWVPPNPLTVGGWIPYPLMLGGWNEPIIWTFLPKTGFQDISMISFDAQKAYCAKTSSLRCHSMVPTLSPYVIMAWTLMEISRHWALLGGMFNDSIRLCVEKLIFFLLNYSQWLAIEDRTLAFDASVGHLWDKNWQIFQFYVYKRLKQTK